jgi:phosphoribosylglycinamide formyltransferase-1
MSKLRLAILVSGSGRTLQNFIDLAPQAEKEWGGWTIPLVIGSRHNLVGLSRAVVADIPTAVVERKSFDSVEAFSDTVFHLCRGVRADLVLLAGWLSLLKIPPDFDGKVMNIHPALLPAFGGKGMFGHHVHEAVLATGCKISGCTVHFVNNDYDAGPIISQHAVEVLDTDTPDTLAGRVFDQELQAYPAAVRAFAQGKLKVQGRRVFNQ